MFAKSGSLGLFMLTRERFEGSVGLYQKMLDASFSKKTDFKRSGGRDGKTGTA
jgi:hypothetical protein